MDARRTWLKHLANSNSVQKWARSCDPALFAGTVRVQTRNTTYLFRNGSCFAVTTGETERQTTSEFVGMRLVGWLRGGDQLLLTRNWQTGVCAVLWGVPGGASLPVALTSPTQRFAKFVSGDSRPRAALVAEPDPTYTRINLPMRPRSASNSSVHAISSAI